MTFENACKVIKTAFRGLHFTQTLSFIVEWERATKALWKIYKIKCQSRWVIVSYACVFRLTGALTICEKVFIAIFATLRTVTLPFCCTYAVADLLLGYWHPCRDKTFYLSFMDSILMWKVQCKRSKTFFSWNSAKFEWKSAAIISCCIHLEWCYQIGKSFFKKFKKVTKANLEK